MPSDNSGPTLSGEDTWPIPVGVQPYQPSVSTNDLSSQERQVLWKHLQVSHPDMAKSLKALVDTRDKEGAALKALMDEFQAGFVIPGHMLPAILKWRLGVSAKTQRLSS